MNIYFSWSDDIFNIIDNFLELYYKIYYRYIDLIKLEKYSCIERILPMFTQFASAQGQVFLKEEYQIQYIKKLFFLYNTFISTNIENTYTEFQCKIFLSLSEIVYKMTNNFHIKLLSSVNEFKSFFNIFLNMVINIWDITRKSIENNNLADFSIYFEYNAECFEYNINSLSHLLVYENSENDPDIYNVAKHVYLNICQDIITIKIKSINVVDEDFFIDDKIDSNV